MTFNEELEVLLKNELKALRGLKELSFNKTDLIISNDVDKLETVLKEEEQLVKVVATLENNRIKLLDNWGVGSNTPISDVIDRVPEGRESLMGIKDELAELLNQLSERNQINSLLVQDNLDWIDFNMNLMTSTQTPSGYGKDSEEKETKGDRNLFDRKV